MATFTAFNLEAEESDDEEIDNTKEIQIEDALKLYQAALKYQSQGPQYFSQAFQAYDTLLKSEIFKYPEALSDWQKTSSQVPDYDVDDVINLVDEDLLAPSNGNDASPSTVPQIVYLIYKNFGELILRDVFGRLQDPSFYSLPQNELSQAKIAMRTYALQALQHFADALERDETDLELWRKTARLTGETFQSLRLLRFCLESVVDQDSDVSTSIFARLNLDEKIAKKDLLRSLSDLSDTLSLSQIVESRDGKLNARLGLLDESRRPFPELPSQASSIPRMRTIRPTTRTWAGVGWALRKAIDDVELGIVSFMPGTGFDIMLPVDHALPTHARPMTINPTFPSQVVNPSAAAATPYNQPLVQSGPSSHLQNVPPLQTSQPSLPADQVNPSNGQFGPTFTSLSSTFPATQSTQTEVSTMTLPTRKRSSASAGNDEAADGGRGRSKRIRARESNAEPLGQDEDSGSASAVIRPPGELAFLKRLRPFLDADRYMINLMRDIYSKLDMDEGMPVEDMQDPVDIINFRDIVLRHPYTENDRILIRDLASAGTSWTNEKAKALKEDSTPNDASATSLDVFLEHLRNPGQSIMNRPTLSGDDELLTFVNNLRRDGQGPWLGIHQICFRWLEVLLSPPLPSGQDRPFSSMYIRWLWPPELKQVISQLIVMEDEHIWGAMEGRLIRMESRILKSVNDGNVYTFSHPDLQVVEMAQTLYELHLDIYSRITSPSSAVDLETRVGQQDRLSRWSALTYSVISHHINAAQPQSDLKHLTIRYLWAATLHVKVSEDASREHVLLCLKDLRMMLQNANNPVILLPNNAVMPEISAIAIDQELSKVNTMDYFFKIFNADQSDPFMVIESLEPILLAASETTQPSDAGSTTEIASGVNGSAESRPPLLVEEMVRLLDRGSTSLKLFLWRRLRNAYDSIGYTSKGVCCFLRCIELVVRDMLSEKRSEPSPAHERQISLLKLLRNLDGLLTQVVELIMKDPESLQEVDYGLEQASLSSLAALIRALHGYHLTDDFRACGVALPTTPSEESPATLFLETTINIRIRAYTLQYILLKDCMLQTEETYPNLSEVLAEYLSSIHFSLGHRAQCKMASKTILRFALTEFVNLGVTFQYRFDLAQVLFDLYGWKLAPEVQIHDCPQIHLDRPTALLLIDFVLTEAKRYNIRDLVKSDLRSMIDKMQHLIGGPESSIAYTINRRLLNAFLKSPINPARLYRATRGIGELSMSPVHTQSAITAEKGWYFLLGHLALSRFKSQQRFSPSTTDDLDIAIAFFKQDLEHGAEKWETWYRLAQAYDAKLYEDLQWGADQINNHRPALAVLQRNAIHSYGMAVAAAIRNDDSSQGINELKAQLFTDFGIRIYFSSREPLSMGAFSLDDFPRHFSNAEKPLYKGQPFADMNLYSAWKFAGVLFKQAIQLKPKSWSSYFHLGKCLWKMLTRPDASAGNGQHVRVDEVIKAFTKAIENLPECRDSRQDPTLEPHYKLVSIVHKLVNQGRLGPGEGSKYLQATPYARDFPHCDELDNWEPYILRLIERLSKEDKSNWHHRISARAAHVIYDNSKEFHAAMGARHQFSQQIFTKTMVLQVWKPENEPVGRHFVYTTRYVQFFMTLLIQLNDRANIDALVKRVRKKPADYFRFPALWEEICTGYLSLLRRQCNIPIAHDENILGSSSYDDFTIYGNRIQEWVNSHREDQEICALNDVMVVANELKTRVNSGLMKPSPFDDLIADAYALIYEKALPGLRALIDGEGNRERMSIYSLTSFDGPVDAQPAAHPSNLPFDPSNASRPRPQRGVLKRDILRKAEALIQKPSAPTGPALLPRPSMEATAQPPLPIRDDLLRDIIDSAGGSSVPGSVHDSADDESELSEVDESRMAKPPLFPGLVSARDESALETEEEEVNGNEEGDENGDENGGDEETVTKDTDAGIETVNLE